MRIGILSMDYPPRMAGGTTVHTYQMARHFAATGHSPHVVSASHPGAPAEEEEKVSAGGRTGTVRVSRVGRPYTVTSALRAGKLRGVMDCVHGHGTCAYGFMKRHRFPTVVKMHSTWLEEYNRYRAMGLGTGLMGTYVRMDRYCARKADAVIAISDLVARETMRYGVPQGSITVIRNGIDPEPFREAAPAATPEGWEGCLVIGYVGRLAPHKGVDALARSFLELAGSHDDVRLLVVGDGPSREGMERTLAPVSDRVLFKGYVPHERVPSYYAASHIMTYPTSYEPLGNVVLESMAAGRPLVASRTGGIPEIFSDECGIMVDPPAGAGTAGLTEALDRLVSSRSLRERMGRTGPAHAGRYTWERVCRRTVEVMEGVLGR